MAVLFDGVDERYTVSPNPLSNDMIGFGSSFDFWVSVWFKCTTQSGFTVLYRCGREGGAPNPDHVIGINTSGNMYFQITPDDNVARFVQSSGSYDDGLLHNAILSGTGVLEGFVDGVSVGTSNYSNRAIPKFGNSGVYVGASKTSAALPHSHFDGRLERWEINHSTMDATKALQVANVCASFPFDSDTKHAYKMNAPGDTSSTLTDIVQSQDLTGANLEAGDVEGAMVKCVRGATGRTGQSLGWIYPGRVT